MLKKNKFLIIFSLILLELITYFIIESFYHKQLTQYLYEHTKQLEIKVKAVQNTYDLMVENIIVGDINKIYLLKLFKKAYRSDSLERIKIREKIYEKLLPLYERLKHEKISQFQFYFPNNTSFLRMHQIQKYGDDLSRIRYSVRIVNTTHERITGFEQGRFHYGFRYIYPLFIDSVYIGAIEIGFSFEAIKHQLRHIDNEIFDIIIRRQNFELKTYNNIKFDSEVSLLSDSFVHQKKSLETTADTINLLHRFDREIKNRIREQLVSNKNFTSFDKIDSDYYTASFLCIKNIEARPVAYVVSYARNKIIPMLKKQFVIIKIISMLGLSILFFSFLYFFQKKQEIKEIDEDYKSILEASTDIIFIVDKLGKQLFFNKKV